MAKIKKITSTKSPKRIFVSLSLVKFEGITTNGIPLTTTDEFPDAGFLPAFKTKKAALDKYPKCEVIEFHRI